MHKVINYVWFQQMYVTSRTNLVVSCMRLFDTFMDDFHDEKYVESISDLDVRAQLEVRNRSIYLHMIEQSVVSCT